jgi:O-acetyl-ADP-ribose deacetylase (regulator of RNase III)
LRLQSTFQKARSKSIAFPLIGAGSGSFNQGKSKEIMIDELQKLESSLVMTLVEFKKR